VTSFLTLDGAEVLKIKPSERADEDVLAWAFEKHGAYSVRSAYRMLKEDQTAMTMANSSEAMSSGTERAWQAVWKIRVPPKARVFWWRILHNSLPSKAELKRRHVEKESHCEVCGDPDETLYHIIFSCTVARKFWGEVKNLQGVVIDPICSSMLVGYRYSPA